MNPGSVDRIGSQPLGAETMVLEYTTVLVVVSTSVDVKVGTIEVSVFVTVS